MAFGKMQIQLCRKFIDEQLMVTALISSVVRFFSVATPSISMM